MAQVPQLVWPDLSFASGADHRLATLDPAGKLPATAVVLRPVERRCRRLRNASREPPLVIGLDRAQIAFAAVIRINYFPLGNNRGGKDRCGSFRKTPIKKTRITMRICGALRCTTCSAARGITEGAMPLPGTGCARHLRATSAKRANAEAFENLIDPSRSVLRAGRWSEAEARRKRQRWLGFVDALCRQAVLQGECRRLPRRPRLPSRLLTLCLARRELCGHSKERFQVSALIRCTGDAHVRGPDKPQS